jgi:plastocyanin
VAVFSLRAAAAAAVALGLACTEPFGAPLPPADAYISVGPGNSFSPTMVTIRAGQTVRWQWSGGGPHDMAFTTAGAPPNCPLTSVGDCLRQFPAAGTFNYVCTPHAGVGMAGTVQVNP